MHSKRQGVQLQQQLAHANRRSLIPARIFSLAYFPLLAPTLYSPSATPMLLSRPPMAPSTVFLGLTVVSCEGGGGGPECVSLCPNPTVVATLPQPCAEQAPRRHCSQLPRA